MIQTTIKGMSPMSLALSKMCHIYHKGWQVNMQVTLTILRTKPRLDYNLILCFTTWQATSLHTQTTDSPVWRRLIVSEQKFSL